LGTHATWDAVCLSFMQETQGCIGRRPRAGSPTVVIVASAVAFRCLPACLLACRSVGCTGLTSSVAQGTLDEFIELMEYVRSGAKKDIPLQTRPIEKANEAVADLRAGTIIGRCN
jgi:hypothetical protein